MQLENLDTTREWRIRDVRIAGNARLPENELKDALLTQARPWYRFWEQRPAFDAVTFRTDLQRLHRLYESRGFYHAEIRYDLLPEEEQNLLTAKIEIVEGPPIVVADVDVQVIGNPNFPESLPIKSGDVFTEDAYQRSEQALKQFYSDQGYAHVESKRKAEVILDENSALVTYNVTPGPPSVFGPTDVAGVSNVDPAIVLRERAYREGETYSLKKIAETRNKLTALDLFGTVNVAPQKTQGKPPVVPMLIEVTEKAPREVRIGVGYGSEDRFRTQVEWRHNNWLGDGRRLSILAKYSFLEVSGALTFIQPHLLSPKARGVVLLRHERVDEETYLLNATRFNPRVEYRFSERFSAYVGYRLEYDHFNDVDAATVNALDGFERKGRIAGPSLGIAWTNTDNVLDPTRG
ncbi:MAG: BamA/OMP85 family outer membrane protein, partial [Candidatus Binatia bacterium]